MDNALFNSYLIEERSYVSYIKREIHGLVRRVFTENRTGEIDIVVSEMTSNLIKYAGRGELLYRLSGDNGEPLFELLCIDNGPGIRNVGHSLRDGVSSTTSLGQGMGSILRMSNVAQVYSLPDWGTIVYAAFRPSVETKEQKQPLLIRCLNVAKPGETVSGDCYAVCYRSDKAMVLVGDGLGHGESANEASQLAASVFFQSEETDPSALLRELNAAVRKTRGLVGTIAEFDVEGKGWRLCGIGNIASRFHFGLEHKNYICHNGIIGMNIPTRLDNSMMKAERYQLLVLCSDGIRTRWDLLKYPSILKYDPMILAAAIYKDHARRTDDMTILIAKVV